MNKKKCIPIHFVRIRNYSRNHSQLPRLLCKREKRDDKNDDAPQHYDIPLYGSLRATDPSGRQLGRAKDIATFDYNKAIHDIAYLYE